MHFDKISEHCLRLLASLPSDLSFGDGLPQDGSNIARLRELYTKEIYRTRSPTYHQLVSQVGNESGSRNFKTVNVLFTMDHGYVTGGDGCGF